MEARYYVALKPRTNETHPIHKEGCPFLSDDEKRIYLGMFRSGDDALKKGKTHFLNSCRCPFCSKDIKSADDKSIRYDKIQMSRISIEMLPESYNQSLFCCIN